MIATRGITLLLLLLLLAACGTGNRLDTEDDGPGGGQFLPTVNEVDSGQVPLTDGVFSGDGSDLLLTEPASGAAVRLPDATTVHSASRLYDLDLDGDLDFIVLTIRPLSAQAAANVTALDSDGATVPPTEFIKVGGAAFEPLDATFNPSAALTLPVHSAANVVANDVLSVFKFNDGTIYGRTAADDIGTGTGVWEYFGQATVDVTGVTVTFDITEFGQYAVATSEIVHDSGGGSDL